MKFNMSIFLVFVFLFWMGSVVGWILELFYRRYESKKWVNPGFLVGPYLPIYGFGLTAVSLLYFFLTKYNLNPLITISLMGLSMTLIELIGGLIFLKAGVRLWDYRGRFLNFKGVICPWFTIIWTALGALYYYFLAYYVMQALTWFSTHLSFSFVLGVLTGIFVIDFAYSSKLYKKIRKYAKKNNIDIMYENLKIHIREIQENAKEKYSFLLPFYQTKSLVEYLVGYKPEVPTKKRRKKANK